MTPRPRLRTRSSAANRVLTSSRGSEAVGSSTTSARASSQSHSARAIAIPVRSAAPSSATGRRTSKSYPSVCIRRSTSRRSALQRMRPPKAVSSSRPSVRFSTALSVSTRPRSWCTNRKPALRDAVVSCRSTGSAGEADFGARVRLVIAGEHFDQRRLAAAVLADHCMHLTGSQVEVDAVERLGARKRLAEPADRQDRRIPCSARPAEQTDANTPSRALLRTRRSPAPADRTFTGTLLAAQSAAVGAGAKIPVR